MGFASKEKSFSMIIIKTPIKLIAKPNILMPFKRSFRKIAAIMEVKMGMVAIMTLVTVAVEYFSPKFSPKKYKKGLNSAERKISP